MIIVRGYDLSPKADSVYEILDSVHLSVTEAARRVIGGYPIFGQNRISGKLHFTVVPYAAPSYFQLATCSLRESTPEEIMASVLPSHKEGDLCVFGKRISASDLAIMKKEILLSCTAPSSLVVDFVESVKSPGRALDLGCGIGANSKILLDKRWEVIGVDKSPEVLEEYNKTFRGAAGSSSILADISTLDLPHSMDLIVASDVLPYVSPDRLIPLISKIHAALRPGGRFIGTLFICDERKNPIASVARGLGANYYRGDHTPGALLKLAGFQIERCFWRIDSQETVPVAVQFIANR